MKAIFTTKSESNYNDLPEERYHFPRAYLRQVEAALNDWIVYYEPRRGSTALSSRGGRQSYFATAQVKRIEKDLERQDHFYVLMSDYLDFERAVPFKDGQYYHERGLQRDDGETNKGAFGRAVRTISDGEYDTILRAGFVRTLVGSDRPESISGSSPLGFEEAKHPFERPVIESVVNRPFREAAFAASVKSAYRETCAITGLRIINGGGRAEVQAAHIRPVAAGGSDSIRNGLALSGTVHWMFDRGLISIDDDFSILVAASHVPTSVQRLIREGGKLDRPDRPETSPHPANLAYHRENVFKG